VCKELCVREERYVLDDVTCVYDDVTYVCERGEVCAI